VAGSLPRPQKPRKIKEKGKEMNKKQPPQRGVKEKGP